MDNNKMVPVVFKQNSLYGRLDCIVVERVDNHVTLAFPFHEDTQNMHMSVSDALKLRDAINEVINLKYLNG